MADDNSVNDVNSLDGASQIGSRIRQLRRTRRLTQSDLARGLGISASYLNLIEHNRRKVTVDLLLAIAGHFGVEVGDLTSSDEGRLASELMEVFSDPQFSDSDVTNADVRDFAHTNQTIGRAVVGLYGRYRAVAQADGSAEDADGPFHRGTDAISDFLQDNRNHFPQLEAAAERIRAEIDSSGDVYDVAVRSYLGNVFGIDIVVASLGQGIACRLDSAAGELRLSDLAAATSSRLLVAQQIALLSARREIDDLMASASLTEGDLPVLARNVLSNYVAAAIVMPYRSFLRACRDCRYDIERLGHRFGASFEQVCHRMTTLQRRGDSGIPFHLVRTDIAGNISKRFSLSGISIPRHSGACPKWNVYTAFMSPERINIQISETPDGARYFCIARSIIKGAHRYHDQPRYLAVGIGCEISRAPELVYADGLDLANQQQIVAVGTSCRICPRRECANRAHPAVGQTLRVNENERPESYLGRIV